MTEELDDGCSPLGTWPPACLPVIEGLEADGQMA